MSQLPPESRPRFDYLSALSLNYPEIRTQLDQTFAGILNEDHARGAFLFAAECSWINSVRPPLGVGGYKFNDSVGLWQRYQDGLCFNPLTGQHCPPDEVFVILPIEAVMPITR